MMIAHSEAGIDPADLCFSDMERLWFAPCWGVDSNPGLPTLIPVLFATTAIDVIS